MPNQRAKDRPRIMFVCDQALADTLQDWANSENRSRSNLIETLLNDVVAKRGGQNSALTADETIDQLKKFIALLIGERDRNGISYLLLGHALDVEPDKLHELVELVQKCRKEHKRKESTK